LRLAGKRNPAEGTSASAKRKRTRRVEAVRNGLSGGDCRRRRRGAAAGQGRWGVRGWRELGLRLVPPSVRFLVGATGTDHKVSSWRLEGWKGREKKLGRRSAKMGVYERRAARGRGSKEQKRSKREAHAIGPLRRPGPIRRRGVFGDMLVSGGRLAAGSRATCGRPFRAGTRGRERRADWIVVSCGVKKCWP